MLLGNSMVVTKLVVLFTFHLLIACSYSEDDQGKRKLDNVDTQHNSKLTSQLKKGNSTKTVQEKTQLAKKSSVVMNSSIVVNKTLSAGKTAQLQKKSSELSANSPQAANGALVKVSLMVLDPQFDYIIANDKLCDTNTNLFIWVHSAPNNLRKRIALRNTWANPYYFPTTHKAKIGFFLGVVDDKNETAAKLTQATIEYENNIYHDIIQKNYIDHYHNLSYKAISAVKWITNHCPQAKLVMKSDDDTLVNTPLLFENIESLQKLGKMLSNNILCRINQKSLVFRKGKWMVTPEEYSQARYPPYCSGFGSVMTGDVAAQLYQQSRKMRPLWVDDAWLLGIVMNQTNIVKHPVASTMHTDGYSYGDTDVFNHLCVAAQYSHWSKIWELQKTKGPHLNTTHIPLDQECATS